MMNRVDIINRVKMDRELAKKVEAQLGRKVRNSFEITRNIFALAFWSFESAVMGTLSYLANNEPGMEGLATLTLPGAIALVVLLGVTAKNLIRDLRGRVKVENFGTKLSQALITPGVTNFTVRNRSVGIIRSLGQSAGVYRTEFDLMVRSWARVAKSLQITYEKNTCKILFL